MRTLADLPDRAREYTVRSPKQPGVIVFVYAPCCGRRTPADTVLDVSKVPGTFVAGAGVRAAEDHEFLCDGCRHRLYADSTNAWTRARLYEAVGASAELVRELYAQELLEQVAFWEMRLSDGHQPHVARAAILDALPVGVNPFR